MLPQIKTFTEKKLIGKTMNMSFAVNKTTLLWHGFMSMRKEITNNVGTDLYSIQIYPALFFDNFSPYDTFDKWACIEVSDFENIPKGMSPFTIPSGLYAVFQYKGDGNNAAETFQYILGSWLPSSDYTLDDRPHFEKLGDKFKKDDPNSEEEIWIPIKAKL